MFLIQFCPIKPARGPNLQSLTSKNILDWPLTLEKILENPALIRLGFAKEYCHKAQQLNNQFALDKIQLWERQNKVKSQSLIPAHWSTARRACLAAWPPTCLDWSADGAFTKPDQTRLVGQIGFYQTKPNWLARLAFTKPNQIGLPNWFKLSQISLADQSSQAGTPRWPRWASWSVDISWTINPCQPTSLNKPTKLN